MAQQPPGGYNQASLQQQYHDMQTLMYQQQQQQSQQRMQTVLSGQQVAPSVNRMQYYDQVFDAYGGGFQQQQPPQQQAPPQGGGYTDPWLQHLPNREAMQNRSGGMQLPTIDTRQPNQYTEQAMPANFQYEVDAGVRIPKPDREIDMTSLKPAQFTSFSLYYKPDCRFCQNFLAVAATHPDLDSKIEKVDISRWRVTGIKGVPTVVDRSTGYQFLGDRALSWLKEMMSHELLGADMSTLDETCVATLDQDLFSQETSQFSYVNRDNFSSVEFDSLESLDGSGHTAEFSVDGGMERLQSMRKQQDTMLEGMMRSQGRGSLQGMYR